MKYTLVKPVTVGKQGEAVSELVFREELVSGDLRGIKASALADPKMEDLVTIAGRLCAQPDTVMNNLGMRDFAKVIELVHGFMNAGQETGTAS